MKLPNAWVICDLKPRERNPRLAALQQDGYNVDRISDANGVSRQWTEDLKQRKPKLLWIAIHHPNTKQGSRADRRQQRKEVTAAEIQAAEKRICAIEGISDTCSWQFSIIQEMQKDPIWMRTEISLCNLGICGRNGSPTRRKLHVLTNTCISIDSQCRCGKPPDQHAYDIGDQNQKDHRQS